MSLTTSFQKRSLPIWLARCLIGVVAMAVALILNVQRPDFVTRVDESMRDSFVRLTAKTTPEERLVVVDIDDASLSELGAWPWSRAKIADMIEFLLGDYEAKGVALDMVFPEPADTLGDMRLVALAQHAPLALAQVFDFSQRDQPTSQGALAGGQVHDRSEMSVPAFAFVGNHAGFAQAKCVGNIGYVPDVDGLVRRTPLLTSYEGRAYPSLASALLNCVSPSALSPLGDGRGFWRVPYVNDLSAYRVISVADILKGRVPKDLLKDRLVLVGSSAVGLGDRFGTSLSSLNAGVMVHAANLSGLMDFREGRLQNAWTGMLPLTLWCTFTILLAVVLIANMSAINSVLLLASLVLTWLLIGFSGVASQAEWSISAPIFAYFVLLTVGIPFEWRYTQRKSLRLSSTFSHYVSQNVLDEILQHKSQHGLEPSLRNITVLIADMEGYTLATSTLDLNGIANLTRDFLETLTQPVLHWRGTLDKYTGDGMVAFWGAPVPFDDHADLAVSAAMEIFQKVAMLSEKRTEQGLSAVRVRIGIESGEALVGDLGSSFRSTYTAVGDCINFASRLEALARELGLPLIIGAATQAQLTQHVTQSLGKITIRGIATEIEVFTLNTTPTKAKTQ
jgi:adenylate cyclase